MRPLALTTSPNVAKARQKQWATVGVQYGILIHQTANSRMYYHSFHWLDIIKRPVHVNRTISRECTRCCLTRYVTGGSRSGHSTSCRCNELIKQRLLKVNGAGHNNATLLELKCQAASFNSWMMFSLLATINDHCQMENVSPRLLSSTKELLIHPFLRSTYALPRVLQHFAVRGPALNLCMRDEQMNGIQGAIHESWCTPRTCDRGERVTVRGRKRSTTFGMGRTLFHRSTLSLFYYSSRKFFTDVKGHSLNTKVYEMIRAGKADSTEYYRHNLQNLFQRI